MRRALIVLCDLLGTCLWSRTCGRQRGIAVAFKLGKRSEVFLRYNGVFDRRVVEVLQRIAWLGLLGHGLQLLQGLRFHARGAVAPVVNKVWRLPGVKRLVDAHKPERRVKGDLNASAHGIAYVLASRAGGQLPGRRTKVKTKGGGNGDGAAYRDRKEALNANANGKGELGRNGNEERPRSPVPLPCGRLKELLCNPRRRHLGKGGIDGKGDNEVHGQIQKHEVLGKRHLKVNVEGNAAGEALPDLIALLPLNKVVEPNTHLKLVVERATALNMTYAVLFLVLGARLRVGLHLGIEVFAVLRYGRLELLHLLAKRFIRVLGPWLGIGRAFVGLIAPVVTPVRIALVIERLTLEEARKVDAEPIHAGYGVDRKHDRKRQRRKKTDLGATHNRDFVGDFKLEQLRHAGKGRKVVELIVVGIVVHLAFALADYKREGNLVVFAALAVLQEVGTPHRQTVRFARLEVSAAKAHGNAAALGGRGTLGKGLVVVVGNPDF